MKKQITITEMSLMTRTIEVEVPSYYNKYGMSIAITDDAVIKIGSDSNFYYYMPSHDTKNYGDAVVDALRYNPKSIEKQEFETHLEKTIKCLTEQYQLSMNMQDPNLQTAEGQQATEETAALESASQDNAMEATECAEEGGAEG